MIEITEEQRKRLERFFNMSDEEYLDKYLADASVDELAAFMKEFPEFLQDEGQKNEELDKDDVYKKIKYLIND